MLHLGLSHAELVAFEAGLASDHKVRIRCDLLDMNHRLVGSATGRVVGGQVDWDTTAEVQRTAQVQVHNPGDVLNLGTAGSPLAAAFYADRMIHVRYEVWSQQLPRWVSVPVFTGPITKVDVGDNDVVTISADDKTRLLLSQPIHATTIPKGTPLSASVSRLAWDMGERFMDVTPMATKSVRAYQVTAAQQVWRVMGSHAGGLRGTVLYYDARGYLVLRPRTAACCFVFRQGTGGTLLSEPKLTFDTSNLANMVTVRGSAPEGYKGAPTAVVYAPADHPLNGDALGRGGLPRWIRKDITEESITSAAAALQRAREVLDQAMTAAAEVTIDALVMPHLEPGDVIRVEADTWSWDYTISKATLPLDGSGHMTIGRTYATKRQLRPKVLPRRGRTFKAVTHSATKIPTKKPAAKKATKKSAATAARRK